MHLFNTSHNGNYCMALHLTTVTLKSLAAVAFPIFDHTININLCFGHSHVFFSGIVLSLRAIDVYQRRDDYMLLEMLFLMKHYFPVLLIFFYRINLHRTHSFQICQYLSFNFNSGLLQLYHLSLSLLRLLHFHIKCCYSSFSSF